MNINVREVLELEDEMAQDHMNTKRKDVFEETAEVVNNVSDVQKEELVESRFVFKFIIKNSNLNH